MPTNPFARKKKFEQNTQNDTAILILYSLSKQRYKLSIQYTQYTFCTMYNMYIVWMNTYILYTI